MFFSFQAFNIWLIYFDLDFMVLLRAHVPDQEFRMLNMVDAN